MVRTIIDEIKDAGYGGIYWIEVDQFPKKWVKVGMAESDIINRLHAYTTYFPKNFQIVAMILYKNDWTKYYHARDVETRLHRFMKKEEQIFGYPRQRSTEWYSLTQKRKNELKKEMEKIAKGTGGAFNDFTITHVINHPI